ncbi:thioredoxin family protein [bacterium]|nr:thioredoxin family protein [bacterium]
MKNRLIILLVFVLPLAIYGLLSTFAPEKVSNSAIAANAPTIIKFSAPLCMDCQKLDKTLDIVMPKYQGKINLQKIDATSQMAEVQEMIKKYNVTVVPTTIFIDSKGNFEKKIEGDIPATNLEKEIKALF